MTLPEEACMHSGASFFSNAHEIPDLGSGISLTNFNAK